MSREFFILRNGRREGPLTEEEILDSLDLGDLSPEDHCTDGLDGRVMRVGEVFRVVEAEDKERTVAPIQGGETEHLPEQVSRPEERFNPVCPPYYGHPSLLTYWKALGTAVIIAVVGYFGSDYSGYVGITSWLTVSLILIYVFLERSCHDYVVTSVRVEVIEGLFSKSSREVRIEDIRAINVRTRGVIGLLGVGTVEFASAGSDTVDVSFENVGRAHKVKKIVRRLQDAANELGS